MTDQTGNEMLHVTTVSSGAILTNGSTLYVQSGGKVVSTTINTQGAVVLSQGACAEDSLINAWGALHVYSGASASNTTVSRNGYLGVGYGAEIYDTTIDIAGALTVWGGGLAVNNTINTWGALTLSSGAAANSTWINSGGGLHVYSGATASNTTVRQGGFFGVGLGAAVYETTIDVAGALTVWGGGVASGNTINTWGALILSSGAAANSTVINSDGGLHVYSGAAASNTTVNQGGFFGVGLGAATYDTKINYAGALTVWGGGEVHRNEIRKYGAIILSSGALAVDTQINADAGLHIYQGATASDTEVKYDAALGVGLGGKLCNAEIGYGAAVTFYDGSLVEGAIDLKGSATLLGPLDMANASLNFNLSDVSWSEGVLLNSIALCQQGSLSIKVDELAQNRGSYALAGGAAGFSRNIALFAGNSFLGTLNANGGKITRGNTLYSLSVVNDTLYLNVDYNHNQADVKLHEFGTWALLNYNTSMDAVSVEANRVLIAENGGSVTNATVNGGYFNVLNGAVAQNVDMKSGQMSAGKGFIEKATVSGGYLTVTEHGTVRDLTALGGVIIAHNGGIAYNNTVTGSVIEVSSEAMLLKTELRSNSVMRTYSGGLAVDTVASAGAAVYVDAGGSLQKAELLSNATLGVLSGGRCENVIVQQGGAVYLSAGANVADLVCLGSYTRLQIGITGDTNVQYVSGGKSYEIRNGSGTDITADVNTYLEVYEGGVISKFHTTGCVEPRNYGSGGALQLHSGAKAFDVDNHASGQVNVFSGALLSRAFTDNDGEIYLYGGYAQDVEAGSSGYVWIHSGGVGSNLRFGSNGGLVISNGGSAHEVLISGGLGIVEEANARITDVIIKDGGVMQVAGATASNVVVSSGGIMTFTSAFMQMDGPWFTAYNGQGYDLTVSSGGLLSVQDTGSATNVTLHSGAQLQVGDKSRVTNLFAEGGTYSVVSHGGALTGAHIGSGARLEFQRDAAVSGLNITAGAQVYFDFSQAMDISGTVDGKSFTTSGDTLSNYTVYGEITFLAGTLGETITVGDSSRVNVSANAGVNEITVSETGTFYLMQNGTAADLHTAGLSDINAGATANGVDVTGGYLTVYAGAAVNDLTVSNGGALIYGGTVSDLLLTNQGNALIAASATVRNLDLSGSLCGLTLQTNAKLTGRIDLTEGQIAASAGVDVIFDLTSDSGISLATPLVTGFENLGKADLFVSVASTLGAGQYKLASYKNGAQFSDTKVQLSVNGASLGTLSQGETVTYNNKRYSLYQNGSRELIFEVSPAAKLLTDFYGTDDLSGGSGYDVSAGGLTLDGLFSSDDLAGSLSDSWSAIEIQSDLVSFACSCSPEEKLLVKESSAAEALFTAAS